VPRSKQNYPDGHKLVNYFDYRKDNAAVLLSREGIKKVKAAMKSEKPNIESWLKPYEEIFRERMGVEGFGSYLDFDTKFIPYIDPRENFKDINDNTHRHIADSMEKKKEGIIGGFKLEWWHIVVGVFGLAAILYVLNVI
jgi:hypothetical protein